jgi:Pex14 N-terminal domain
MALREEMIARAVKFLLHPKVVDAPLSKKVKSKAMLAVHWRSLAVCKCLTPCLCLQSADHLPRGQGADSRSKPQTLFPKHIRSVILHAVALVLTCAPNTVMRFILTAILFDLMLLRSITSHQNLTTALHHFAPPCSSGNR